MRSSIRRGWWVMGWREPELARDRREAGRLVLAGARVLYVNGQTTEETVAAARRLGHALDLPATVIPRWGELQLDQEGSGCVAVRSEEHTSELQSPCNLVCRLLLEKKKKK